MNDLNH